MSEHDEMPDPKQIPSAEWLLHHLDDHGDDAGADFNDGEAIQGYFGWSTTSVRNSASGKPIRHELEVWWEPLAEGPDKPKRHIRRFLVEEITGQRGSETVDV